MTQLDVLAVSVAVQVWLLMTSPGPRSTMTMYQQSDATHFLTFWSYQSPYIWLPFPLAGGKSETER